jgi:D-glycero-D-manno-heptose 1,7-bisphosphate phosphatase
VTNQSGVARGFFALDKVHVFNHALKQKLLDLGAKIEAFYVCPHLPDAKVPEYAKACDCRKPAPGMVLQAAREHSLNLAHSFMVGDKFSDVDCAIAAGVVGIQFVTDTTDQKNSKSKHSISAMRDLLQIIR